MEDLGSVGSRQVLTDAVLSSLSSSRPLGILEPDESDEFLSKRIERALTSYLHARYIKTLHR